MIYNKPNLLIQLSLYLHKSGMYYKYAHDNSLWIHKHINKDVLLINRILNRILQDDAANLCCV